MKPTSERFGVEERMYCFMYRRVMLWNSLPGDVVRPPTLDGIKRNLDIKLPIAVSYSMMASYYLQNQRHYVFRHQLLESMNRRVLLNCLACGLSMDERLRTVKLESWTSLDFKSV